MILQLLNKVKKVLPEQPLDSGRETMHLRTLFDARSIDQNLRPIRNSTDPHV